MTPTIGRTETGQAIVIDVRRLLVSRLLLQADSGGGKTVALKRLLEQTHPHVQQIIIDPEGEFSTLREKFDYILCAPDGADAIANPKTARILARKLRETRISAVIDIFDLKPQEQKQFVRYFVEELMVAPKSLWNPCMVVIDEAQVFAPENDKAESLDAVMDLRGRGRKRGLCPILATPRLAQLSKDAAAGLQNKLIGVTTLDLDVKRAARDLSMTPAQATDALRNLEPGEFYCFGPAFVRQITKIKVGAIQTRHGDHTGRADSRPPAPSEKIKAVLAKLTDLPKEAEAEARTVDDLRRENANLKRELTLAKKAQPTADPEAVARAHRNGVVTGYGTVARQLIATEQTARRAGGMMAEVADALDMIQRFAKQEAEKSPPAKPEPAGFMGGFMRGAEAGKRAATKAVVATDIGQGEQKVLTAIAQHDDGVTREQITVLTGYKRSSRDTYLQRLRQKEAIHLIDDRIYATPNGVAMLGSGFQPLPTGEELRTHWLSNLPDGERRILEVLVESYPDAIARTDLDERTGYKRSSRDTYIQRLRSRELVDVNGNAVRASERLF